MTTTLPDLIAALESAADGNVMLDRLIMDVAGWKRDDGNQVVAGWAAPPGLPVKFQSVEYRYTRSVDAALTLVPEEWEIKALYWCDNGAVQAEIKDALGLLPTVLCEASTPALAICAAALRARQEEVK